MFAFIHRPHHFQGRAMDLSCECDCDCESWANRIAYVMVVSPLGHDEYLLEKMLCERCYCKNCAYYWGPTHSNPWRN